MLCCKRIYVKKKKSALKERQSKNRAGRDLEGVGAFVIFLETPASVSWHRVRAPRDRGKGGAAQWSRAPKALVWTGGERRLPGATRKETCPAWRKEKEWVEASLLF